MAITTKQQRQQRRMKNQKSISQAKSQMVVVLIKIDKQFGFSQLLSHLNQKIKFNIE